jgi:arabinose-5-phosphate isomerase
MSSYQQLFQDVLLMESQAINQAKDRVMAEDIDRLLTIFQDLTTVGGHLIFSGVGKSALVAKKLSSTFVSLGLPSFFLHPTEALHGDLGMVNAQDALVLISKSGTTEELLKFLPYCPIPQERIIGLIGHLPSPLSKKCSVLFDCSIEREACVNNLAPTTSTTLVLAMGDAMAVLYESFSGLTRERFAVTHPGGQLGKSLLLKVSDVMIRRDHCAIVNRNDSVQELLMTMTRIPHGIAVILTEDNQLEGIVVEGDIRRCLMKYQETALTKKVYEMMNTHPITLNQEMKAIEALVTLEQRDKPLSVAPVLHHHQFEGIIRVYDLVKEGLNVEKNK